MKKKAFSYIVLCMAVITILSGCGSANTQSAAQNQAVEEISADTQVTQNEAGIEQGAKQVNAGSNTISEEAKTLALQFPDVSGELPAWRGTNLVNKAEFGWPWVVRIDPETDPDNTDDIYTEALVEEIADAGFNFVRLVIDARYILTDESMNDYEHVGSDFFGSLDTVNETQLENMDRMIEWCIKKGIHVCIDCHSTPGGLMIGGDEEKTREPLFTKDSEEQALFKRYWEIIANRYADVDTRALSFNLYNEPPCFVSDNQDVYIDLMNEVTTIVENASPDRLIFIDGLDYATRGLDTPENLTAKNLVIGFHLYANECQNMEIHTLDLEACASEIKSRIAYYDDYAGEHHLRWMLQEMGTVTSLDNESILGYSKLIVDECLAKNVSWAHYGFSCNTYSLVLYADDAYCYTPGATYDMTPAGHKINRELVNILTVR